MTARIQRFLAGAIAFAAVAAVLSFIEVGADPGNGKGKSQGRPDRCVACSDPCVPETDPLLLGTCSQTQNGDAFVTTRACCCCGEDPQGRYFQGFRK